mmetsp:Transcript_2067/g.3037  ORF Transcript_2067/g.3037 Transcript_2067/m.3037 type:complete len:188 (+) Transcript_2067:37-600(+)
MCSPGNELLEPFRPRRRKVSDLKEDEDYMFGLKTFIRLSPKSIFDARLSKNCSNLDSREATEKVKDFRTTLLNTIHDDRAFQKLKEDMRKEHRSGFASQQVVYKLIMETKSERIRYNEAIAAEQEEALRQFQQHMTSTAGIDRRKFMANMKKNINLATEDFRSKMSILRNHRSLPSLYKKVETPPCA